MELFGSSLSAVHCICAPLTIWVPEIATRWLNRNNIWPFAIAVGKAQTSCTYNSLLELPVRLQFIFQCHKFKLFFFFFCHNDSFLLATLDWTGLKQYASYLQTVPIKGLNVLANFHRPNTFRSFFSQLGSSFRAEWKRRLQLCNIILRKIPLSQCSRLTHSVSGDCVRATTFLAGCCQQR